MSGRPTNLFTLKIIQRQSDARSRAGQHFLRIATLLFAALHVVHFAVRAVTQPLPKFTCMRWLGASCYATGIKTNLPRKRHELRLQISLRSLSHHAVVGIGVPGCGLAPTLPSLLKIARATSSFVSIDVSTRTSATLP